MDDQTIAACFVLIANDSKLMVRAGTLVTLISYALAGPSSEASTASRDRAIAEAHAAMRAAACLTTT